MLDFFSTTVRLVRNPEDLLWEGFKLTVELAIYGEILALALGLVVALMRLSPLWPLRAIATAYVEFFRDTPFLIQLFWIYYALPSFGILLSPYAAALIAVVLYIGSYHAEIFRAGIQAVPRGQILAARGLGMSRMLTLRRVVLPQAVRMMIPPLVSTFINLVKSTSFTSTISVAELTSASIYIGMRTLHSMEILTAAALIYFLMIYPLNLWVSRMETRLMERH